VTSFVVHSKTLETSDHKAYKDGRSLYDELRRKQMEAILTESELYASFPLGTECKQMARSSYLVAGHKVDTGTKCKPSS
jgi:hypothetical protein